MSNSDIALAQIDQQIESRDKRIAKLRPTLEGLERERDALMQTRAILAASPSSNGHKAATPTPAPAPAPSPTPTATNGLPMLDVVEDILGNRELHVKTITKELHARGIMATKAVVTTALARRAAKEQRFRRVEGKPNTFARLKQTEQ